MRSTKSTLLYPPLLLFILILLATRSFAQQPLASPQIINYDAKDYEAGTQNWNIVQNRQGVLFFGNNEGLLTFNGHYWNTYPLPNKTVIRSVGLDDEGKIFVGGQDEIGYFSPNQHHQLQYHSLKHFIPPTEQQFGDVWNLAVHQQDVFFRESNKILHYRQNGIAVYKPSGYWTFLGQLNGKIYAQDSGKGVLLYTDGYWKPLFSNDLLQGSLVTAILPYDNLRMLIVTLDKGLFLYTYRSGTLEKFANFLDKDLAKKNVYAGIKLEQGFFAFGTTSGGLLLMDHSGNQITEYAYREGLQTNNVRSIYQDQQANIWLGLDDGIAMIPYNKPINYIFPDKSKLVTGYAMSHFNNSLYFGTSDGVYSFDTQEAKGDLSKIRSAFTLIPNTNGQVWNIQEINGKLLLSHDKGLYEIDDKSAFPIYYAQGTWAIQPVSPIYPAKDLISGTYTGLHHIQFERNTFHSLGSLNNIKESIRFLFFDTKNQSLWASHPYRGIYNFKISPNFKFIQETKQYEQSDGLPSNLYNYIFKVDNRILAGTQNGIYSYSAVDQKFKPDPILYPFTKGLAIQYLKEDRNGNIWFVNNKRIGLIRYINRDKKTATILYFPELEGKLVGGHEFIFPYDDENIFIATNKGFIHLNLTKYEQQHKKPRIVLNRVSLLDSANHLLAGGFDYPNFRSNIVLSAKENAIHFEYASPSYAEEDIIEFSHKLSHFDSDWSSWEQKFEKDYTNLSPGHYTFLVKARDQKGEESEAISYDFEIKPAWYQHPLAYFIYVALGIGFIYFIFKRQTQKFRKVQLQQVYLHQLEINQSEQEIVRLKNEKLEAEVAFKDKELNTITMHLVQRGEVLNNIKQAISQLSKKNKDQTDITLKSLMRIIREAERTEEDWENFSAHFNHVNADYFDKLRTQFPDITPHELKLCAYIKMNLTSKEIAQLMNITIKAVEVSRYRLRKKLQLSPDMNLNHFLSTFYKE